MKALFLSIALLAARSAPASEVGPQPAPASVNGVYHLIVHMHSEAYKQIRFSEFYPNPANEKTLLFFGSINGQEVSGELRGIDKGDSHV